MAFTALLRRELTGYFLTPLAWIYLTAFVLLSAFATFYVAGFMDRGQADLGVFFGFHPWLHLLLVSALAMRLWAEERRAGTLELLLTLPIRLREAVLAKFLAAWLLVALALLSTTPVWITAAWLGDPDHGVVLAGYLGSWLVAGTLLAMGACASAMVTSQVAAFISALALGLAHLLAGLPELLSAFSTWLPPDLVRGVAALSITSHFDAITRGLLDLRDLCYFLIMICAWLMLTLIAVDLERVG